VYLAAAAGQVQIAVAGDVEALAVRRTGQTDLISNHLAAMAAGELPLCQAGLTLRELEKDIHVAPPEEKNSASATAVLLSFPAR